MTETRIVRTEKTIRGPFGQICKWGFILFNLLMLVWMISTFGLVGNQLNNSTSEAYSAGTALGGGLAVGFLLVIWALGDIILGMFVLFTRGKRMIIETAKSV